MNVCLLVSYYVVDIVNMKTADKGNAAVGPWHVLGTKVGQPNRWIWGHKVKAEKRMWQMSEGAGVKSS